MTGYTEINIQKLSETMGEEYFQTLVSDFSCPLNEDVENFLKHSAMIFARQGIAATNLVFASYRSNPVLTGYYTLANKHFHIDPNKAGLSNTMKRKLAKFGQFEMDLKKYIITAPLIGQLGKNFSHNYNELISGAELLKFACNRVKDIQYQLGGKFVYLECEDKPALVEFYSEYGFCSFGRRRLEADEAIDGTYLIQMLKYLK